MEWANLLITMLSCVFEVFILFDFFRGFFEVKVGKLPLRGICAGTVALLFLINLLHSSVANLVLAAVLLWAFVCAVFEARQWVRLGCFVLSYAVMLGVEFLYGIMTGSLDGGIAMQGVILTVDTLWQLMLAKFVNYVIFLVLRQLLANGRGKVADRLFFIYLCVPVSTIGIMLSIFYAGIDYDVNKAARYALTVFLVCMLAGNVLFFYAFQKYAENLEETNRQKLELLAQNEKIERLTRQASMRDGFQETIHDVSHYLKLIGVWASENRADEISGLVRELHGSIEAAGGYDYCPQKMLNVVLKDYECRARDASVSFDAYVEPGSVLDVRDADLMVMLGNLLDNAVAAASSEAGAAVVKVRIFMQRDGKLSIVKVANDFTGTLSQKRDGSIESTKQDGGIHGIGLISVEKAAERYGGYLEHFTENAQFIAVIVLPVSGAWHDVA